MKCLIVDDEALARERLQQIIADMPDMDVCGTAGNGRDALQQVQSLQPDVVFLDIRMPVMDGLEAARHLAALPEPPAVIFTTAYEEHALQAFEAQAVDYLLKPARPQRVASALEKASRLTRAQLGALAQATDETAARSHICAQLRGNLHIMPIETIRYFQADNKYVTVRDAEQQMLIEEPLKSLEQEFGERFLRIHRNALVAVAHIQGVEKSAEGQCLIRLQGIEDKLEVSRRHTAEVRRWLRKG